MKYFGYGMNTNIDGMKHRCPECIDLGKAILDGYKLRFAGHADIIEHQNSTVEGVLWEITDDCLRSLDLLEGYPIYYDRKIVNVMYQNQSVDAIVYFMQPGYNPRIPSTSYFSSLMEGYNEHNLNVNQLTNAFNEVSIIEKNRRNYAY